MARGDTWTREELLILFEELHSREWKAIRSDQGIAEELSELLQSTYIHVRSGRDVTFRSPDAVQRKAYDFITSRREIYQGKQTRGGHGVRDLLKTWSQNLMGSCPPPGNGSQCLHDDEDAVVGGR